MSSIRQWQKSFVMAGVALSIMIPMAGCGKAKQPWEKVYPARGVVSFKGKALVGAQIILVPQDDSFPNSVRPSATSQEDGSFSLGTFSTADGAPAGDYKAVVLHYPVVGPKDNPVPGRNVLPAKYARPETTDLRVTISADAEELPPLELK
jgi:hypothetical protein